MNSRKQEGKVIQFRIIWSNLAIKDELCLTYQ